MEVETVIYDIQQQWTIRDKLLQDEVFIHMNIQVIFLVVTLRSNVVGYHSSSIFILMMMAEWSKFYWGIWTGYERWAHNRNNYRRITSDLSKISTHIFGESFSYDYHTTYLLCEGSNFSTGKIHIIKRITFFSYSCIARDKPLHKEKQCGTKISNTL